MTSAHRPEDERSRKLPRTRRITQAGEIRVLSGRGMPVLQRSGRGDHRILVNVAVPRRLTPEQRKLLEDFAEAADDQTYAADDGFFQRLKSAFR